MIMVPSVPVISTTPVLRYGESKLNTLWLTPPPSNWAIALMWVGTSTGNSVLQPVTDQDGTRGPPLRSHGRHHGD